MKTFVIYCLMNACQPVDPGAITLAQCNQLVLEQAIPECRQDNAACRCVEEVDHQMLRQAASPN